MLGQLWASSRPDHIVEYCMLRVLQSQSSQTSLDVSETSCEEQRKP